MEPRAISARCGRNGRRRRRPTEPKCDRNKTRLLNADVEFGLEVLRIHGGGIVEFVIGFVGAGVAQGACVFSVGDFSPRCRDDLLGRSFVAEKDAVGAGGNALKDETGRNVGLVRHFGADDDGIVAKAFVGEVGVGNVDVLIGLIGDFLQDALLEEFLPLLRNNALS